MIMAKGVALRDRTAAAIIDSAAAILAERGETASMEDIGKVRQDRTGDALPLFSQP